MNLKKIRIEKGFTQSEVARHLEIAQNTYCNYENGNREPDIITLMKLADLFKVSIDELFGYKEKSKEELVNKDVSYITEHLTDLSPSDLKEVKSFVQRCLKKNSVEKSL